MGLTVRILTNPMPCCGRKATGPTWVRYINQRISDRGRGYYSEAGELTMSHGPVREEETKKVLANFSAKWLIETERLSVQAESIAKPVHDANPGEQHR
jgi:hypothetical protein